jgi:hypothetical protein
MRTMVNVIATGQGWDGIAIREPGEEFQMPEGATGSWFEPLDDDARRKPKPVAKSVIRKPKLADPPGGDGTGSEA